MRVNAGDSIPISRKEREAPRDCGCKGRKGKVLRQKSFCRNFDFGGGTKSFCRNFAIGGVGPPLFGAFQPYPLLYIPQGVSRGTGLAWQVNDQGHDGRPQGTGRAPGQA